MKKKILLVLLVFVLLLGITTGCSKKEKAPEENKVKEDPIKEDIAEEYTTLKIFGGEIKFKKQNPTYFWDTQDSFNTGEIDTFYIVSKNGEKVEDYYNNTTISGIAFYVSDEIKEDKEELKKTYKNWDKIDVEIKDLEDDLLKRYMKGENDKLYIEAYYLNYEGKLGKETTEVNYKIELRIDKNQYSEVEVNKIKSEFNTIIETLELN